MALIKCPECSHMISEYADKCIYCGCPMSVIKTLLKDKEKAKKSEPTKKQNLEKKQEKKPVSFICSLSNNEKALLDDFTKLIKERIPSINPKESTYTYGFKVANEINSLCWFTKKEDGRFVLKYYDNPIKRDTHTELRMDSPEDISNGCKKVFNLYKIYYIKNEEKNLEKAEEQSKSDSLQLYKHIIDAVKGKKIKADEATKGLCTDIAKFVLSEVGYNAIAQKDFKNITEFNQFKYARRYIANFFGYTFSFRRVDGNDAKVFYMYYKSSLLVNIIKRYETIYNKQIIFDYDALLKSFYKMIKFDSIDYSRADGLLSDFNIVPIKLLDQELERLQKFEK